MSANEKQNDSFLDNREYQNQEGSTANHAAVVNEEHYGIDDFKSQNDDVVRNDFSPDSPNPDQITNDDDDFLNSDYPEEKDEDEDDDSDDEDLEEEAENSVDEPGDDFNEPEEIVEDPEEDSEEADDYDEDLETEFPEDDPRKF
jgi:hypothetical protein